MTTGAAALAIEPCAPNPCASFDKYVHVKPPTDKVLRTLERGCMAAKYGAAAALRRFW